MEMQTRLADGVAWLTEGSRGWDADNAFVFHNFCTSPSITSTSVTSRVCSSSTTRASAPTGATWR